MSLPEPSAVVPLPSGRHGMSREAVVASQRERLVTAMIGAAAEQGYARVTVEDVSRRAHTAKRTFYELFADKEACFLAAYEEIMADLLRATTAALLADGHPVDRIARGVRVFIGYLADHPEAARVGIVEILGAGPAATTRRVTTHQTFADELLRWHEKSILEGFDLEPLSATVALSVIGAVNEPVTMAILRGGGESLRELSDEVVEIVARVMFRPRNA